MNRNEKRGPAADRTSLQSSSTTKRSSDDNASQLPGLALLINGYRANGLAVKELSRTDWLVQCPNSEHTDTDPSCSVQVNWSKFDDHKPKLLISCPVCGRGYKPFFAVCEAAGVPAWKAQTGNEVYAHDLARRQGRKRMAKAPLTEAMVERYREYLHSHPNKLQYLHEHRCLTLATIDKYEVGYDEGVDRYIFPVRNPKGELVNLRRYLPGAKSGKMLNLTGWGHPPRLYPNLPRRRTVVVVEGELDALLARQHGLPACTGTHGAGKWQPAWSRRLAERNVIFIYDCDKAGRENAELHASAVARHAAEVRVVNLGLGEKEDLTDWFVKHRRSKKALIDLIHATPIRLDGPSVVAGGGEGA